MGSQGGFQQPVQSSREVIGLWMEGSGVDVCNIEKCGQLCKMAMVGSDGMW
jgi:hypothetical protein